MGGYGLSGHGHLVSTGAGVVRSCSRWTQRHLPRFDHLPSRNRPLVGSGAGAASQPLAVVAHELGQAEIREFTVVTAGARRPRLDIGVYGARGIPSTYGGYETFLTVMLPELARRGHRVTAYCRRGHLESAEPFEGVNRVVLPAIGSHYLETLSHGAPASLVARLRCHDVVLVVNLANAPFCMLARATGQRIVLNLDGQEWLRGKWGPPARGYWLLCARLARWAAPALVADCQAMSDIYRDRFSARTSVIPYCWTGLKSAEDPLAVLEKFSVEPYRYFVVAARLNPENNVAEIAEAYVRTDARYPLLVLGAANYASPVRAAIEALSARHPSLRIGGHVADRAAFATLVSHAAAYLHGHSVGGINPSLIEAMGCGANIMALATPFNREALGSTGTYFRDFHQLEKLLSAAQEAPAEMSCRSEAQQRAREVFSVDAVVEAYENLFHLVVKRPAWATTSAVTSWADRSSSETIKGGR